ncbi:MAG: energy transducer TonB [Phycisphaeraceae bacterium]|nr:energy transducer TonB [Phycisphaerales bacterium]MCB9843607.1 energy transducer TonB [Phycisphaeraceae bacterium]
MILPLGVSVFLHVGVLAMLSRAAPDRAAFVEVPSGAQGDDRLSIVFVDAEAVSAGSRLSQIKQHVEEQGQSIPRQGRDEFVLNVGGLRLAATEGLSSGMRRVVGAANEWKNSAGDALSLEYHEAVTTGRESRNKIAQRLNDLAVGILGKDGWGSTGQEQPTSGESVDRAESDGLKWADMPILEQPEDRVGDRFDALVRASIRPGVDTSPIPDSGNDPPVYPLEAIRQKIEGTVLLTLVVEATGRVSQVNIVTKSGSDILDRAATEAAWQWRFSPATSHGEAIECEVAIPVRFIMK